MDLGCIGRLQAANLDRSGALSSSGLEGNKDKVGRLKLVGQKGFNPFDFSPHPTRLNKGKEKMGP